MNKQFPALLIAALMLSDLLPNAHAATGDSLVTKWKDNKTATFCLMYDDGGGSGYSVALPEMQRRGMNGTYYLITNGVTPSSAWATWMLKTGATLANHTRDHANVTTYDEGVYQIGQGEMDLMAVVPGKNPRLMSYAQPGVTTWVLTGAQTEQILAQYNLISRPKFLMAYAGAYDLQTAQDCAKVVDGAITKKGFGYVVCHGLERRGCEGDPDDGGGQDFQSFNKEGFRGLLNTLRSRKDDLWVTDTLSADMYMLEANNAVATPTVNGTTSITVSFYHTLTRNGGFTWNAGYKALDPAGSNGLLLPGSAVLGTGTCIWDPALFDQPLTVTTSVPTGWTGALVTQGTSQVYVPVVSGTIQYDAVPGVSSTNAQIITLTPSALPVISVTATTPEAYETGTMAGAFTITTTGTAPLNINYTIAPTASGTAGLMYTTGTDSGRYTINKASPVAIGSGSSATTVSVVPIPDEYYQGESAVLLTILPGSNYVVGSGSSAFVVIHDRTDSPPHHWYLHASTGSTFPTNYWNTTSLWFSSPTGGVVFPGTCPTADNQYPAYSPGTARDYFHANGFSLGTRNTGDGYPDQLNFFGNNIVLDGTTSKITCSSTYIWGTRPSPTNKFASLTSYGGMLTTVTPGNTYVHNVTVSGTFANWGPTTLNSVASSSKPGNGINLIATTLTGTGNLIATNPAATGTYGAVKFSVTDSAAYSGNLNVLASTLMFTKDEVTAGSLTAAAGAGIYTDCKVSVNGLTLGGLVQSAGTYTPSQLNGVGGVTVSGTTGSITNSVVPSGWADLDIGVPGSRGFASYSGTTWAITAGGTLISGSVDKFNFASTLTSGSNPGIIAQVTSVPNTTGTTQAGVMLRDGVKASDSSAAYAALTVSQNGVVTFGYRLTSGTAAVIVQTATGIGTTPIWLKLVCSGSNYTGYYSKNATSWTQVGSQSISFKSAPQAGLALCSGNNTVPTTATFANVASDGTPQIVVHPQSQSVTAGANVFLVVSATDSQPLTYQWQKNLSPIATGGTSSTLSLNNAQPSDSGTYSVIVSNPVQSITSNLATLTVNLPSFTISTAAYPAGSGATGGSGSYQSGTSATVSATPANGYGFAAWTESGTSSSISSNYTFNVNGNRTLVANFQPATLATWKLNAFAAGQTGNDAISGIPADPDGDGYSNLLEYALGMNATATDRPTQQVGIVNGYLTLTYKRSKTATDLTCLVEVSNDLQTWKSDALSVSSPVIQNDDGYTQTIQVRDLTPSTAGTHRFIRLRITTP